ncbi:nuclease-related domain-containing protein [Streptomyces sp. G-G2]|uniref:nuclease-related domain-containing protein n=1 Tax=Streptomyces sp. G-G2 TaxID=3046201 RepID=UPI0024B905F2|nr:nuclease-related domain-containing protein [Streptomyces sp. G-G2]MDJ0379327.1 nuclease-related domain-containing protein [Streptomyces sp. G-G2]
MRDREREHGLGRGLKVLPDRGRLWVNLPDGRSVAWYDREAGRVSVLSAVHRDAALAVLRPYLSGAWTVGPPAVPSAADLVRLSLHPDDDLAPNRPGEALLGELEHGAAGARTRHRLRPDLLAQERVGAELDALEGAGWRVLHAVPLPGAGRVDHLLIGPGGVWCVRTVAGRRQRVQVGDLLVTVGRAAPRPDVRWARRAAERATHALVTAVTPALAVSDATRLDVAPSLRDVEILEPGTAAARLTRAPATLKPSDVDTLYTTARNLRTWTAV